ncbi:immunoglobulin-like domain-containing protein [Listeria cornellensis]
MDKIQLRIADNVVKEVAPKGDGTFEFINVADLLVAGSDVRVSGLDKDNIIQKSAIVTVRDYRLSVESYQVGQRELVGTCGQDIVSVDFQTRDGIWLSAIIDANLGRFHFSDMTAYNLKEEILLEARNSDGDICQTMTIHVKDYTLIVPAYEMGKVQLDGVVGKDIVKVQLVNGSGAPKTVDVWNQSFQFTRMLLQDIQPTSDVMIQGLDSLGKVQNQQTLSILDYTVTAPFLEVGQDTYSGTYGKDVYKVRILINGTAVQATTAGGVYTFTGLKKYRIQTKDTVDVIAVQQEKHIERYRVPVLVYDFSLSGSTYVLDQAVYAGSYGEHIQTVALVVNKVQKATATKGNGMYTFTNMAAWIKNNEDMVEIVGIDAQGVVRKTYPLSIKDERLLVSDYVLGEDTYQGTFGGAISKVRLWVDGGVKQQAQTSQGTFTFSGLVPDVIKNDRVLLEIVGVNSNYVELARRVVPIVDYHLRLATATYILGSPNYLTGSHGKDIVKIFLFINGEKTTRNAGYTGDGFQIYLPLHVKSVSSATQVYELVGFDKDDQIRSRQAFTVIPK